MPSASAHLATRRALRRALLLGLGAAGLLIWKLLAMTNAAEHHAHADLPRFTELPAFDPYREQFECRHEAAVNPAASDAAHALFEQAMALDGYSLDPRTIDYQKVAGLYLQAMALGHWKAQFNLAGLYLEGKGMPPDPNEALRLTEDLMRKGVPAAWFNMGNFYMSGVGPLKADATVAYAFWQRAADMGSLHAQALLGKALDSDVDMSPRWANRPIGRQMLECAFAQGSGEAADQLGISYANEAESLPDRAEKEALYAKAMHRYHEGVKFGSEDCAVGLFSSFGLGDATVGHAKDPAREVRYFAIADYLRHHPDIRLPNLDRVLPLPPAKLPFWDGKVESLIRAAQPVRPVPQPSAASRAAAAAPGRARVPRGQAIVLPEKLQSFAGRPIVGYHGVLAGPDQRMGLERAPLTGYYQPVHIWTTHPPEDMPTWGEELQRMRALAQVPPLFFRANEPLNLRGAYTQMLDVHFSEEAEHGVVYWRYAGQARATAPLVDPLAAAGLVRAIAQAHGRRCGSGETCPRSGIWQPEAANAEPPLVQDFDASPASQGWRRQAFVQQGEAMPVLSVAGDARAAALRWRLMEACEPGFDVPAPAMDAAAADAAATGNTATTAGQEAPTARAEPTEPPLTARTGQACPRAGVWEARMPAGHPNAAHLARQGLRLRRVAAGHPMPELYARELLGAQADADNAATVWVWVRQC